MKSTYRLPKHLGLTCLAAIAGVGLVGCSMCCGPYDYHYPAFPGVVGRTDPTYGRVGSVFSDPYKAGTGPSADSNLKPTVRKPDQELDDLDSIPEPLPDSDSSPLPPSPREPMKIDRETRSPEGSVTPRQWR